MSTSSVQPPYEIFTDIDGQPLEDGYIWIGTAGLPAISNPITVYWNAALTIPAVQPIRTIGGYPMNSGTPAVLYISASDYSILVQNKNGSSIYSSLNATERYSSALVTFLQAGANAVQRTAQAKMRDIVSVKDFGAVGDGVANDTSPIQAAINYAQTIKAWVYFPPVQYGYLVDGLTIGQSGTNYTCHFIGGGFDPSMASAPITGQFEGQSLLKLRDGNNNKSLVTINPDAAPPQFVNMTFNGNKTNVTGTSYCIFMDDVAVPVYYRYACWMENCLVTSGRTGGLFIGANRGAGHYNNVWVQFCGTLTSDSAINLRCFDQQFNNVQIGPNPGVGMFVGGATQVQFEGCVWFLNRQHLIVSQDAGSVQITGCVFDEADIDGVSVVRGVAPSGGSGARVFTNCVFRKNGKSANNTYSDIVIDSDRRITLDSCQFTGKENLSNVVQYNIKFESTSQTPYARVVSPVSEDAAGNSFGTAFTNSFASVMLTGTRDSYVSKQGGSNTLSFTISDVEKLRLTSTDHTFYMTSGSFVRIDDNGGTGTNIQLNRNNSANENLFISQFNGTAFIKNLDSGSLVFTTSTSDKTALTLDVNQNVIVGASAVPTSAGNGFLYVPTCAGTPVGTPSSYPGRSPIVVDSTNNKLYFYSNGTWRDAGP